MSRRAQAPALYVADEVSYPSPVEIAPRYDEGPVGCSYGKTTSRTRKLIELRTHLLLPSGIANRTRVGAIVPSYMPGHQASSIACTILQQNGVVPHVNVVRDPHGRWRCWPPRW